VSETYVSQFSPDEFGLTLQYLDKSKNSGSATKKHTTENLETDENFNRIRKNPTNLLSVKFACCVMYLGT